MQRRSRLREFVDALVGPRHDYREGVSTFAKIDIPRLKRDMRLAPMGEERGTRNQPAASSEEPDEIEHRIFNAIQTERDKAVEQANAAFVAYSERLATTSVEGRATDIKVAVNNRIADFIAAVADGENRLHLARRTILEAERGLSSFRARHGIERPAHYPESHWLAFGAIAVIVFIESVLNGMFLGQAQLYGILGGVAIALILSTTNILLGFAAGRWGCGGALHRNHFAKLFSVILLLALAATLFAVNLGAAHYRAMLLAGNYRTPEVEALKTLLTAPLGVGDLMSWFLFTTGTVCAVVAAVKGWTWDDPYPGYGKHDRHYRNAAVAYEEVMRDVMDELNSIKNDAVTEAQELKEGIDKRQQQRGRIVGQRHRLAANFAEHMCHLEGALRELTGTYREANMRLRTAPPPARFGTALKFESGSIIVSEDLDARKSEAGYAHLSETLETAIKTLLEEHAGALRRFRSIENLPYEEVTRAVERKTAA